jgi:hypothetical protein
VLLIFVQERVTAPAFLVLKRGGVVVLTVSLDPGVDTLPAYSEHTGDVGGGATIVKLQDGEGTPKQASIPGLRELTPQPPPLPGGQFEPAHGLTLHH